MNSPPVSCVPTSCVRPEHSTTRNGWPLDGFETASKPATPAEQFQALIKDYQSARADLAKAKTDEERKKLIERRDKVPPKILELAQNHPREPIAVDALFDMV